MAHYDCSNCGAFEGIDFGYCTQCTPQEVLDAKKDLEDAKKKAALDFDKKMSEIKCAFIAHSIKSYKETYDRLYHSYKP